MKKKSIDHTQLLLLKLLSTEDMYGYQIILELARRSSNVFEMKEGTLYPVLHGMEREGYVEAYEKAAPTGRMRKYYHLTRAGRAAQVGRLTADEANDLRNELAGHIEDHAEALVEHGYTEEDAAARAVALMGDPEETGRALCAQYGGWWLVIVQRAARILTAVLCVMIAGLIVKSSGLYGAIRDRYEVQKPGEGWERWNTETPGTRIPIGDDIVRIDTVSCSTQRAEVQLTAFDRIPGGVVYARLLHTLRLENERGEVIDEWEDCDYPSCVSSSGTLYVCIASHRVNIEPDDTYIRLIYDRLGEHVALESPLPGREAQP